MEEEEINVKCDLEIINVSQLCQCFFEHATVKEPAVFSARKEFIFSAVSRTEQYLRERRIPELIRFLFTKVIAQSPNQPVDFLEKLLNDCMLFRAGHGLAPVLYEDRHLKAVIKSFDPGQRGWLTTGQVRRLYTTLGFTFKEVKEDRISSDLVLECLKKTQENELFQLLSAGSINEEDSKIDNQLKS